MIFPSKAEGFSLVILEAMSSGVPVIINGDLEFALSEKCLKYVNKDDFEEQVLAKILNHSERQKVSENVRQMIINEYSWRKVAKDYYEFM